MPTPPLEPVLEPTSELEREAREAAAHFMTGLLHVLHDYTYSTRSHVPGGNDCTDFFDCLAKIGNWTNDRPDWTADILAKLICENPKLVETLQAYRTLRAVMEKERQG